MPRFDGLTPIHKAIRAMVYAKGGELQTADFGDEQIAVTAAQDLETVLRLMHDHHTTEERLFFPELEPFEPDLVGEMLRQHGEVVGLLGVAEEARTAVLRAAGEPPVAAGVDLNRRFNELVAFYFEHLAQEEAEVLPALWRHLDDDRLMAIQGRIVAESDPGALFEWLGWMFKGLNRMELVGLLSGAKAGMPPAALERVKELGASSLDPAAWAVVRGQAGL